MKTLKYILATQNCRTQWKGNSHQIILFDKDSFWLKLSKFIPLELYLLALFSTTIFFFTGFEFSIYGTFISSFLSIGFLFTVIYIFNKQINSYENKTDFFKNTFVYKIFRFIKISFKNTLISSLTSLKSTILNISTG